MNQGTRLFKTLGCLVAAMTGTSALLGWIDPSPPIPASMPSFDVVLHEARALVSEDFGESDSEWGDVEIVAGPVTRRATSFLAATSERADYHYRVDLDGHPYRARNWPGTAGAGVPPSAARIQVARRGPREPMSRAQWIGVQALVAALNEVTGSSSLAVRLGESWARIYGFDPQIPLDMNPLDNTSG